MPEVTEWFPPEIRPVRPGIYETNYGNFACPIFVNWNGKYWDIPFMIFCEEKIFLHVRDWPVSEWRGQTHE